MTRETWRDRSTVIATHQYEIRPPELLLITSGGQSMGIVAASPWYDPGTRREREMYIVEVTSSWTVPPDVAQVLEEVLEEQMMTQYVFVVVVS